LNRESHPFEQQRRQEDRPDRSVFSKVHREERRDPGLEEKVLSFEPRAQSFDRP
jgi:hypothetical protein